MDVSSILIALLAKIKIVGAFTRGTMVSCSNNRIHIALITSKTSMNRALIFDFLFKFCHAHWADRAHWLSITKLLINRSNKHWLWVHVCEIWARLFADILIHAGHLISLAIIIWLTFFFFLAWWTLLFFMNDFVKVNLWKRISTCIFI